MTIHFDDFRDVVVITVNYRLGALGFMTFGNDVVSGNMGLREVAFDN